LYIHTRSTSGFWKTENLSRSRENSNETYVIVAMGIWGP
jgi:hypothetical protein